MEREAFDPELRQRLRSYFHASKHLRLADSQKKLLTHMPPSLQGEVSWKIHQVPLYGGYMAVIWRLYGGYMAVIWP